MSTGGQAIGGVLGAVGGFFVAGPKGALYGAQIGIAIGGYLDPPKGPVVKGPRLSDLSVQTATYGAPIARGYGTFPVVGNIFWLENNKIKETVRRKKSSSGGKGGGSKTVTETYSYSATFAVGLLDCRDGNPIDGACRIWVGSKLIYDAGSDDLQTIIASNQASSLFTLYPGSATQLPDDRMQSTLGVANTPAYRGLAYIVFKDFPLADYSNSLVAAQVKVEVVKSGSSTPLSSLIQKQFTQPHDNQTFAPRAYYMDLEKTVFYVPQWANTYPATSSFIRYAVYADGSMSSSYIAVPGTKVPPYGRLSADDDYLYGTTDIFPSLHDYTMDGQVAKSGSLYVAVDNYLDHRIARRDALNGLDEKVISVGYMLGGITTDGIYIYVVGDSATIKYDLELNVVATGAGITAASTNVGRAVLSGGRLYFMKQPSASTTIYQFSEDLSTYVVWASGLDLPIVHTEIYIEGNIIVAAAENPSPNRYLNVKYYCLDTLTGNAVTLASIVQAECLQSRLLSAGDLDVTALTQAVRGFKVSTIAPIRSAIEPLQGAWPFDAVQVGYKIKFVPRGGASVATISAADLDARGIGEATGVSITNVREMDSEMPRKVIVNYLDVEREYDTGSQWDERLNTEAVNTQTLELAIVLNATEALGIVQTLLYLYWMERYSLSFSLPPTYNHLQPADVVTVNANEATYALRLTDITYTADGRLECSAKYNAAAIYTHNALGASGQSTGQTLALAGESIYALLDIPTLLDSLDAPGFLVAMTGALDGWLGGELLRTDDEGQTWDDVQGFIPPGSAIGVATNVIGAAVSTVIDSASVLQITLVNGDLSSVSELALLGGANWFAYGAPGRWEIIGAKNCVLNGAESYALSDFLRGRQGTEWATGLHVVGDAIVALDSSSVAFVGVTLDSVGMPRTYRGVTLGRTIESASDRLFTYSGVNLKPLSPVYLNGSRHPVTRDWTLTWIRRTRVGGAWRDYVDAALGEASEAYEIEIDATYNGDADYASVALLMKFNGSDLSTTFVDEKGKTVTPYTATIRTLEYITGGSSAFFNGAARLSVASHTDFDFGTGNFTVEFWVRPSTVVGTKVIVSRQEAGSGMALQIGLLGAAPFITLRSAGGTGLTTITSTGALVANTWARLSFVRSGSTVTIYIDNVAAGSGTASNNLTPGVARPLAVGCLDDTSYSAYFSGYADELRITKGVARTIAGPPETDLPASSDMGVESIRLLTATSPEVSYSSTLQAADFGGTVGTLSGRIFQISADVGRGYPLEFSITR